MEDKKYYEFILDNLRLDGISQDDSKVDKKIESRLGFEFERVIKMSHFRHVEGGGALMGYNGYRYELLQAKPLEKCVSSLMAAQNAGGVYRFYSPPIITSYLLRNPPPLYNPKKHIVSFNNCVLDLELDKTLEGVPHSEELETDIYLPYDYNSKAKCPQWRAFLNDVVVSESNINVLQEYIGSLFVDRSKVKIEKILFLLGDGANGKGVFGSVIEEVLGPCNISAFSLTELFKSSHAPQNIAMANGKLANICQDMSATDVSGGAFKRYVSGEPMTARLLYGSPYIARQLPLSIIMINESLASSDKSFGDRRRKMTIEFPRTFTDEQQNPNLKNELCQELSGIFNWAMEGRLRFIRRKYKYSPSADMENTMEREIVKAHSALSFMREMGYFCHTDEKLEVAFKPIGALYDEYVIHCKANGIKYPFKKPKMGKELEQHGYLRTRSRTERGYDVYVPKHGITVEDILDEIEAKRGGRTVKAVQESKVLSDQLPF